MLESFTVRGFARIAFGILLISWLAFWLTAQVPLSAAVTGSVLSAGIMGVCFSNRAMDGVDARLTRTGTSIFAITLALLNATLLVWAWGRTIDTGSIYGAIFASWVANLAFFLFLGIVIFFVQISKPENLPFEARARIFFSNQTGPHIDHAIEEMKKSVRFFAEKASLRFVVRERDAGSGLYQVDEIFVTDVKCYLRDVSLDYPVEIHYRGLTPPPAGRAPAKVSSAAPDNGGSPPFQPAQADQNGDLHVTYPLKLRPTDATEVAYTLTWWWRPQDEPNSTRLNRYTLEVLVEIHNDTQDEIRIRTEFVNPKLGQKSVEPVRIPPGHKVNLFQGHDIEAGANLFDIRIF